MKTIIKQKLGLLVLGMLVYSSALPQEAPPSRTVYFQSYRETIEEVIVVDFPNNKCDIIVTELQINECMGYGNLICTPYDVVLNVYTLVEVACPN